MHRFFLLLSFLLTLVTFQNCNSSKVAKVDPNASYRIGFYNVENLFDIYDHPDKIDEAFTPTGKQEWNAERYEKKLTDLDRVIGAMGYPTLLGLCEVENKAVLEDLAAKTGMAKQDYGIVHYESPDKRGIDCALMYQKRQFKVEKSDKIRVNFPASIAEDYTSRDIIYVKGLFLNKYPMHIFVNHWPSRRGGLAASEPKRTHVAQHLKDAVDKIFAEDPNANIVIVGDMNDEPANNSVQKTLGAKMLADNMEAATLYNCMAKLDQQNKGSYNYRGNWNMLDHIITSASLLKKDAKLGVMHPSIFREEWMMFNNPKYGPTPNRTYGGPNYYGGFSDHLPVFVDLVVR